MKNLQQLKQKLKKYSKMKLNMLGCFIINKYKYRIFAWLGFVFYTKKVQGKYVSNLESEALF